MILMLLKFTLALYSDNNTNSKENEAREETDSIKKCGNETVNR
jgi:hypothetical protein